MPEKSTSLIDKTIAFFSPETALKRAFYKEALTELGGYDAANPGGDRKIDSSGFNSRSPESAQNSRDRYKMMWEARSLCKNFAFIKSYLLKEAMYVCGKMRYQSATGDPEVDKQIEGYWGNWEKSSDAQGRFAFQHQIQLGHMGMRADGEYGWQLVPQGQDLRIQAIEADRIGNPNEGLRSNDDNYYSGIKVNDLGQVTGYDIYKRSRMGQYSDPTTLLPAEFVHYFDPMRSDQYHGVTVFDTVLPHARDLYELLRLEKLAVKWGSSHAGVITKDAKNLTQWKTGPNAKKTDQGTGRQKVEAGTLLHLQPGEDVRPFQTSARPSPTFNGFVNTLVREMANGLNLPYSFVWDMAALGGVSARIELAMAQRSFKRSQQLLVQQVLDPIKEAVLARALSFGHIPAHPNWRSGSWQFPAHITADQGYATQSDLALMNAGLKTGSEIIAEQGRDHTEVIETLAKEARENYDVAAMAGVPMEMISQRYPQGTQMMAMMHGGGQEGQENQ